MKEKIKDKLVVYTDGGSRGNPGPAAIGVVIKNESGDTIKTYSESIGRATNNEAEYRALILALKKIKSLIGGEQSAKTKIDFKMDSELIVNQLSGKFKLEEESLFQFFIKIWNLRQDFAEVKFGHVPREKNKEADRLVNQTLDAEQSSLFK